MSNKETVIELIKRLPSDVSMREIVDKIEFIAAIQEGLEEIDQGKQTTIAEVEKMIDSWITK